MKKQIRKYEYAPEILMPIDAEIFSITVSNGKPAMWALVSSQVKNEKRYFKTFGTGWEFDDNTYPIKAKLGTIFLDTGEVLCHLFEIQKP